MISPQQIKTEPQEEIDKIGEEIKVDLQNTEEDEQEKTEQRNIRAEDDVTDEDTQDTEHKEKQEKMSVQTEAQLQQNTEQWRKLPVVSKKFTVTIKQDKWQTILLLPCSVKLRSPWTNVFYNSFRKKKSLLYSCFQESAHRNNSQPKNQKPVFEYLCSLYFSFLQC